MVAIASVGETDSNWPHKRLVRWASWARCPMPGAEGSSEGYLRERTDHAHPGEPTAEIAETDKAVARMRAQRPDYWSVFARFYLSPDEISTYEIAMTLSRTLERVEAQLRQAQILVGHHIHNVAKGLQFSVESVQSSHLSALSRAMKK